MALAALELVFAASRRWCLHTLCGPGGALPLPAAPRAPHAHPLSEVCICCADKAKKCRVWCGSDFVKKQNHKMTKSH